MEKLVYFLWNDKKQPEDFNAALLGPARIALAALGLDRLKINVIDDPVAPAKAMFPASPEPMPEAMVSFWINSAHCRAPYERVLRGFCARYTGYAAAESTVLPLRDAMPDGERWTGFAQVALLNARPDLTRERFLDIWLNSHSQIGVETQDTKFYIQNIVIRTLTADSPALSAIVEEGFPLAAMTDPLIYWKADGSPERQAAHYKREMDSCERFLDMSATRVMITSEYRFGGWRDPSRGWHERG